MNPLTNRSWYFVLVVALSAICLFGISPAAVRADSFDITWTGPFGSGSVTVDATAEGGGEFLITSLTGTQAGLSLTLEPAGTYGGNDNFIFPAGGPSSPCTSSASGSVSAGSELDNCGFAITDGTNLYDIFTPYTDVVPGVTYWECSSGTGSDCAGLAPDVASELTSFSITPATGVPEPDTILLLFIGFVALLGAGLRRKVSWTGLVKTSP